jgi:hypothetical protein
MYSCPKLISDEQSGEGEAADAQSTGLQKAGSNVIVDRSMESRWTASNMSDYLSPISLRYVVFMTGVATLLSTSRGRAWTPR